MTSLEPGTSDTGVTMHCHYTNHSIRCQQPNIYCMYTQTSYTVPLNYETKATLTPTLTLIYHR